MVWNGVKLVVTYDDGRKTDATRNDLIEYLPQLDLGKVIELQNNELLDKKLNKTYGYDQEYIGDW